MTQSGCASRDWIVAIDGGGSKVAGALAKLEVGEPIERVQAIVRHSVQGTGSASPATWGQASKNIVVAIEQLLALANVAPHQIRHVVLMLAGAGRADDVARVRQTLSTVSIFQDPAFIAGGGLTVTSDMRPLLDYATGLQPKLPTIVLIAGTGSLVAALDDNARDESQRVVRAGGWGPVLGDEGSGWRMALSSLKRICDWIDRGSPTLSEHVVMQTSTRQHELPSSDSSELQALFEIVKRFATEHRLMAEDSQLNSAILALASDRHLAARLAPAILDHAARSTEGLAYQLVDNEVAALAAQVETVHRRMRFAPHGWRLGLTGGLASNHVLFQTFLNKTLHQRNISPESLVVLDPLLAALNFASTNQARQT